MIHVPNAEVFESQKWSTHAWVDSKGTNITVLQREPFRISWIATRVVTYVFLIPRKINGIEEIEDEYKGLRDYAGKHKKTWLPIGVQCGYALLPIYLMDGVSSQLAAQIRSHWKKRWCVFHIPSVMDLTTGRLCTSEAASFWGCLYRDYIRASLGEVSNLLHESEEG